jgi:protein-disulfide isomerase
MATGPQQKRKELREKRLKAEAKAQGADRRQNLAKILGIAAFLGVIAIAVIVFVSASGGDSDEPNKSANEVNKMLEGIPQDGMMLGDPKAPVTLVEFADLQCPVCKLASEEIIPELIDGPVRGGEAKYEFANWAILGPDSVTAAKAAYAAAEQNRLQQFVENFYANQGTEGTAYVTDEFLRGIAEDAGVPDLDKWEADRDLPKWDQALLKTDNEATAAGFSGTPSFAIRNPDGSLDPIELSGIDAAAADQIIKAINQAK